MKSSTDDHRTFAIQRFQLSGYTLQILIVEVIQNAVYEDHLRGFNGEEKEKKHDLIGGIEILKGGIQTFIQIPQYLEIIQLFRKIFQRKIVTLKPKFHKVLERELIHRFQKGSIDIRDLLSQKLHIEIP